MKLLKGTLPYHRCFCLFVRCLSWLTLFGVAVTSLHTHAQQKEWRFEIEVILFKRDISPQQLAERFELALQHPDTDTALDLLGEHLSPDITMARDGLPYCLKKVDKSAEFAQAIFQADKRLITGRFAQSAEQLRSQGRQSRSSADLPLTQLLAVGGSSDLADIQWPNSLPCVFADEQFHLANPLKDDSYPPVFIPSVPTVIDGLEWVYDPHPYLLSKDNLALTQLAKDIHRQRGLSPFLHFGWRQEVAVDKDKAQAIRLFAGENFADRFAYSGHILPQPDMADESPDALAYQETDSLDPLVETDQADLIAQIRQALADEQAISFAVPEEEENLSQAQLKIAHQLWELDGTFKVFLRYIKGVPYLHIDSQLDFRAPVFSDGLQALPSDIASDDAPTPLPDFLQSFRFNQLRRVISKQIHYFDHPLFGMVVQIRRFRRPELPDGAFE